MRCPYKSIFSIGFALSIMLIGSMSYAGANCSHTGGDITTFSGSVSITLLNKSDNDLIVEDMRISDGTVPTMGGAFSKSSGSERYVLNKGESGTVDACGKGWGTAFGDVHLHGKIYFFAGYNDEGYPINVELDYDVHESDGTAFCKLNGKDCTNKNFTSQTQNLTCTCVYTGSN